ncbi:MAG: nuclear transport factor 2 family protein [Gammaproteobacteria bacterium]
MLALAGCASMKTSASAQAADEAAIAEFNKRYLGAINSGDIATLSSLTTEGHMAISSGRPPMAGKEALVATMSRAFERFRIDEAWTPLETMISGDLAYQRGTFTVDATPKAGGSSSHTAGNFVRIYRKQPDGSWRMVRDVLLTDQPVRPAGQ